MTPTSAARSIPLEPDPLWSDAAFYRQHVRELMRLSGLHWRLVAAHAGVSPTAMHTLLYGRDGQMRPLIHRDLARALANLDADELRNASRHRVPSETTRHLLTALRQAGFDDVDLQPYLTSTERALRTNRALYCSALTQDRVRACYDMLTSIETGRAPRSVEACA